MSANSQHYYWAGGHVCMFLAGLRYLLAWVVFKGSGVSLWYKIAFVGAIVSYAIVVKKSLGYPKGGTWLRRALADENFQYFLLSCFLLVNRPVGLAIIPFWTFSTFHVATFARSTLIPKFIPPVPNPSGSGSSSPPVSKAIQFFIKKYYDPSMKVVSYVEVAIFARVLFGLPLRSNSLLTPIVYGIFLRSRYYQSPFTREAFKGIDSAILQALSHPQVGGAVPQATAYYNTLKTYLARAAGNLPAPTAPPASATAADTSSTPRASSANPAQ